MHIQPGTRFGRVPGIFVRRAREPVLVHVQDGRATAVHASAPIDQRLARRLTAPPPFSCSRLSPILFFRRSLTQI
jgi:hypothetical protein